MDKIFAFMMGIVIGIMVYAMFDLKDIYLDSKQGMRKPSHIKE